MIEWMIKLYRSLLIAMHNLVIRAVSACLMLWPHSVCYTVAVG